VYRIKNPFDPGSPMWMNRMRENAKKLSEGIEERFFPLGETLEAVAKSPHDDDEPLYKKWGYKTFREYCIRELKISYRKAAFVRSIYKTVTVDLEGIPKDTRTRFLQLGYSKLRRIVTVVDRKNIHEWIRFSEHATTRDIVSAVALARARGDETRIDATALSKEVEEARFVPPDEMRKSIRFFLTPHERSVLEKAIEVADVELGDESENSQAQCLRNICLAYVADREMLHELPTAVLVEALIEQGFGVVLVDPSTKPHTLVEGADVLNAFSVSHEEDEEEDRGL
jgi:hypothetical protein